MLIETERKRALADTDQELALRTRLTNLGYYCPQPPAVEVDTYYSRPDVDFMATVECLRVRERDDFTEVTYKPASDATTHSGDDVIAKHETNVPISDGHADEANALLRMIGMIELAQVVKTRRTYRLAQHDELSVAIDQISGVGLFVEVEVTAHDHSAAADLIDTVETQLGIAALPIVTRPYRDLVMQAQDASSLSENISAG